MSFDPLGQRFEDLADVERIETRMFESKVRRPKNAITSAIFNTDGSPTAR